MKYFNIEEGPISPGHFQVVSSQHKLSNQSSSNAKDQHCRETNDALI